MSQPQRAIVIYRTKPLEAKAKWSLWFQREIAEAKDSNEAMKKFYDGYTWPAMTGSVEVKQVEWPDGDPEVY